MIEDFIRHADLYLDYSTKQGVGLFSRSEIKSGETIEKTPVLLFSKSDQLHIDKTNLYNYYFSTDFLNSAQNNMSGGLALGLMSYCNHDDNPNATIEKAQSKSSYPAIFTLRANKDIMAGDEIFISYGELWFEPT